jgi:HEAT repeat protein
MIVLTTYVIWGLLALWATSEIEGQEDNNRLQIAHYHCLLKDYSAACNAITTFLQEDPDNTDLLRLATEVYAKAGEPQRALACWHRLQHRDIADEKLLAQLTWSVLATEIDSAAPLARLLALLGSAQAGTCENRALIQRGLLDNCQPVRMVACRLAGDLKIRSLAPMLTKIMLNDRSWQVRCASIEALAALKLPATRQALLQTALKPCTTIEERHVIALALSMLDEQNAEQSIEQLSNAENSSMRLLACEIALSSRCYVNPLLKLMHDPTPAVKAMAMQALGVTYPRWTLDDATLQHIIASSTSPDIQVAISASWLLTVCGKIKGFENLKNLLNHPHSCVRAWGAAALAAAGAKAVPYLQTALHTTQASRNRDSITTAILAVGLLSQRADIANASVSLRDILIDKTQRWRWEQWGIFRSLVLADHAVDLASLESADLGVRLELINLLAIVDSTAALKPLKGLFNVRTWGVSGAAALLLLSEGDDTALEVVQQLLTDAQSPQQRLQAALILALWGRSEGALEPLNQAYANASREDKERILGALGHLGMQATWPLLIRSLESPCTTIRIHGAAALLQVLWR